MHIPSSIKKTNSPARPTLRPLSTVRRSPYGNRDKFGQAATANSASQHAINTAISDAIQDHLQTLGLGGLSPFGKRTLVNDVGQRLVDMISKINPGILAKEVLGNAPGSVKQSMGRYAVQNCLHPSHYDQIGSAFQSEISQGAPTDWGSQVVKDLAKSYLPNFRPADFDRMPQHALRDFSQVLQNKVSEMAPTDLGQRVVRSLASQDLEKLGALALSNRSQESLDAIGYGMARSISGSPTTLVESIFSGMGPGALQGLASGLGVGQNGRGADPRALGQQLFSQLTQLPAGQQAIQQAITGQGLTLLKKFGTDKLTDIGGKLLGKLTKPIQDKLTKGITNLIGNGLGKKVLSEFGSGILRKFGGIGGTLSSLMSGDLNLSSLLKTGLSLIPGIGTIYSAVSAIPVIGPFVNKVIDGVIGFAKKIPILGHILKGAEKVIGWVGKGLKTVWGGVKKVGKAIWSGVKKVGKAILGGVKKVGKAIWSGVKKVGSAIIGGIKKVGSAIAKGIKKFFSGW